MHFETPSLADGLMLQGRHWTVDAPRAVVSLVHGFGEHCGRYEELAAELVANRIAVVGVDLRGHGKTVGPRGVAQSYDHLHEDLKTLLQQTAAFYPAVPHFLFGHSMGGGLVLHHGMVAGDDDSSERRSVSRLSGFGTAYTNLATDSQRSTICGQKTQLGLSQNDDADPSFWKTNFYDPSRTTTL